MKYIEKYLVFLAIWKFLTKNDYYLRIDNKHFYNSNYNAAHFENLPAPNCSQSTDWRKVF